MTLLRVFSGFFPLFPFFAAVAGFWLLLRSGLAARVAMDIPNHRSLHLLPVPKIGGLVLVPAFLFVWLFATDTNTVQLPLVAVLAIFSYMDDRSDLSAALRLGLHLAVAVAFVLLHLDLRDMSLVVAAVLWVTWCTNLYNFMDGADGLAGGMALFGFSAYGLAALLSGDQSFAVASFSVAAASAGFLLFNFPPAKIFMGDAGSIPLGFLMGALGLLGWQSAVWPFWFPLLVFSPFIADATVTLLKRALRGERVWVAHREHYYQRLVRMGWTHRRLALGEYVLMAAVGLSAITVFKLDWRVQFVGLLLWVSLYAVAMIGIDIRWQRHLAKAGEV
jgi:UDP-N-acetylmuramyl pentapeptide phosphotransferase/UDP-N-acetylglucosamine-1-phosphate transferase